MKTKYSIGDFVGDKHGKFIGKVTKIVVSSHQGKTITRYYNEANASFTDNTGFLYQVKKGN